MSENPPKPDRLLILDCGTCDDCGGEFFYHVHIDFRPRFCPYCGQAFHYLRVEGGPKIEFKDKAE